jgi:hypothetical protein
MSTKHLFALGAVASIFCSMAPLAARADAQDEWFQKQLQLTDGYAPGSTNGIPQDAAASATRYVGTSLNGGAENGKASCNGLLIQQQQTDGYVPVPVDPSCGKGGASERSRFEGTALTKDPSSARNGECKPIATKATGPWIRSGDYGRLFTSDGMEISAP